MWHDEGLPALVSASGLYDPKATPRDCSSETSHMYRMPSVQVGPTRITAPLDTRGLAALCGFVLLAHQSSRCHNLRHPALHPLALPLNGQQDRHRSSLTGCRRVLRFSVRTCDDTEIPYRSIQLLAPQRYDASAGRSLARLMAAEPGRSSVTGSQVVYWRQSRTYRPDSRPRRVDATVG